MHAGPEWLFINAFETERGREARGRQSCRQNAAATLAPSNE